MVLAADSDRKFLVMVAVTLFAYTVVPKGEGGWGFNPDHTVPLSQNTELLKTEYTDEEMVTSPPFLPFAEDWLHSTNAVTATQIAEVRDRILADGIPALTFAAGANVIGAFGEWGNYNYQSATLVGWPKTDDNDNPVWEHSDIKNVAYFYVRQLFKKIVDETKQRR